MRSPRFISVLIVARPGIFRDSLAALISAIPYADRIYQEYDFAVTLKRLTSLRPDLVLIDADLPGVAVGSRLVALKKQHPHAAYLVLVSDVSQEAPLMHAGADVVLVKGTHADKLLDAIEAIIPRGSG
jgi:DNA-binding NarL/FixJ family response regulator